MQTRSHLVPTSTRTRSRRRSVLVPIAVVALASAAACGADDGATVRDIGGTDGAASGSASASGAASGTASASGSASGVEPVCQPVGDGSTADSTLAVTLDEWTVTPAQPQVPTGLVNIVADNVGEEPHEVVVVKGADIKALPTMADGAFDEEAYGADNVLGEIEGFPAGESCNGVFDLAPGSYVFLCNLVEEEDDGTIESHFAEGMASVVTVTS